MASRRLGVHSKDRPARKALQATVTDLSGVGLMFLSERGPDEVFTTDSSQNWEKAFGFYRQSNYGKYALEGLYENLFGIPVQVHNRRFVAADAVAAEQNVPYGAGALTSIITLLNEIKADYNAHRVLLSSHPVADTVNVVSSVNAFDKQSAIVLANEIKAKYNGHNADIVKTTPVYHATTAASKAVTADDATNIKTLIVLANQIKTQYNLHRVLTAPGHTAADSTNAVASTDAAYPGSPTQKLKLTAAYLGRTDKGAWGNRLGYTIRHSSKFNAKLSADAAASQNKITLDSIAGFTIGDYIKIRKDTVVEGALVTDRDEQTNTLTLSANLANAFAVANNSSAEVLNFDILIWKKNYKDVLELVEENNFLSVANVPENFVTIMNDLFSGSGFSKTTDLAPTVETNPLYFIPYEVDDVVYYTTTVGADGTAPSTADWISKLADFTPTKNIRHMANPDTTSEDFHKAARDYCKTRGDAIWYTTFPSKRTYDELKVIGQRYLIASDSYSWNNAQWVEVVDPIGIGNASKKEIPNVGHIIGHAIYRIITDGYQRVPAGPQFSIAGITGVVGDQITDDDKRTILADLGVNCIQFVPGSGYVLRNARMASTDGAYRWFNQIFMRIVYKKTFEESFKDYENVETGEQLLNRLYWIMYNFLLDDWNGNARTAGKKAFLQLRKADGQLSTFTDAVTIICDQTNNSLAEVLKGNVTADLYFFPPPPAESIEIGVGISLVLGSGV